jgi:hypothetical protein
MSNHETLPPETIRKKLIRLRVREQQCESHCAFYLRIVDERRYYLLWGYASTVQYAEAELSLTPKQTWDRLRVAKALANLPVMREALREGRVGFSAVREMTRVATRATERDWVEVAGKSTVREIEGLVGASRDGEVPTNPRLGLPRNLVTVSFQVTPDQMAMLEAACEQYSKTTGARADLAQVVLSSVRYCWSTESAEVRPKRKRREGATQVVYVKCSECGEGAVRTADGFVAVPKEVIAEVEKEARRVDASEDFPRGNERESAPDRPEVPPQQRDSPADDRLRELVLLRDGYRCTVPGCGSQIACQAHHITWRRHGGKTKLDNMTTVCAVHHAAIHQGILILKGSVSGGVEFKRRAVG